jgi:hypothetical protein
VKSITLRDHICSNYCTTAVLTKSGFASSKSVELKERTGKSLLGNVVELSRVPVTFSFVANSVALGAQVLSRVLRSKVAGPSDFKNLLVIPEIITVRIRLQLKRLVSIWHSSRDDNDEMRGK